MAVTYEPRKRKNRSPAYDRALKSLPQALEEGWSASRFAEEAMVSPYIAGELLNENSAKLEKTIVDLTSDKLSRLAEVARKVRDAEADACDTMVALIERLTKQIKDGQDLDAKELDTLIALRAKYQKHIESVTGMDVLKAAAIRQMTDKDGPAIAWDGVDALECITVAVIPEAPRKTAKDLF